MNRNTIKLTPLNSSSGLTPGSIITFKLPTNSLVDLHSLALMFGAACTATSGTNVQFPKHTSSLIQRLDLIINGVQCGLSGCSSYGDVFNVMSNLTMSTSKAAEAAILEGAALLNATPVTGLASGNYCVNHWLGLLSGDYVRFLDTSITGEVEIKLTLAPAAVLAVGASTTGATYTLNNVYALCEVVTFEDSFYQQLLLRKLASGQPITLAFQNWQTLMAGTNPGTAGSVSFYTSTQSLDLLIAAFKPATYSAADQANTTNAQSNYYLYSSDTNGAVSSTLQSQFLVSGRPYPAFPASARDAYVLTRHALDGSSGNNAFQNTIASIGAYERFQFAFAMPLCMPSAPGEILKSGLNTMGQNIPLTWQWSGAYSGTMAPLLIAGMTSQVDIYPGRSIIFTQ